MGRDGKGPRRGAWGRRHGRAVSLAVLACLLAWPGPAAAEWASVGLYAGVVRAVVLSPSFGADGTAFATVDGGGLYRSLDGGRNWSLARADSAAFAVAFSPDYASDRTVFASASGGGVLRSADGGDSWLAAGAAVVGSGVASLAVSPNFASDGTVFAGAAAGVFRSEDRGQTWVPASTGFVQAIGVSSLALSPAFARDGTAFAGTAGIGLYRTTDGGDHWAPLTTGASDGAVSCVAASPEFERDRTVFAGTAQGVWRSVDGGDTWVLSREGLSSADVTVLVVSPDFARDATVFAARRGAGLYRSTDAGATWAAVDAGVFGAPSEILAAAASPAFAVDRALVVGTWGNGVLRSADAGVAWEPSSGGIEHRVAGSMVSAAGPGADGTLFLSSLGAFFRSEDGGATWVPVGAGLGPLHDGGTLSVSPAYPQDRTVFAGTSTGLYRSVDGGGSWQRLDEYYGGVAALISSPAYASDRTVFAGTPGGVRRSLDGGGRWDWLGSGMVPDWNVQALALSPAFPDDHTLFAGTFSTGLFRSTDAGTSFRAAGTLAGEGSGRAACVAASPRYASDGVVLAGMNGADASGAIYRSESRGTDWIAVTSGASGVSSLLFSPRYGVDAVAYAGTESDGVLRSLDGGHSWFPLGALAPGRVTSLAATSTKDGRYFLVAATAGGVYRTAIDAVAPTAELTAPADGAVLDADLSPVCQVTGTAADDPGGVGVLRVDVSTDGGQSWAAALDASGDGSWTSWSYSWAPSGVGARTVAARAMDRDGSVQGSAASRTVHVVRHRTLTTGVGGPGSVAPASGPYLLGTRVEVTATPQACAAFTGWEGDASGTDNPIVVTLDADRSVSARFETLEYALEVGLSDPAGGTVSPPAGVHRYSCGTAVTLEAAAAPGYVFVGWEGLGTASPLALTLDRDRAVRALFAHSAVSATLTQAGGSVLVEGRLGLDGQPAPRRPVKVEVASYDVAAGQWRAFAARRTAVTAADGSYVARLTLREGIYRLRTVYAPPGAARLESGLLSCTVAALRVVSPSPADGAKTSDPTPPVVWEPLADARAYRVEASASATFRMLLGQTRVDGRAVQGTLPSLTERGKKVFWRVVAELPQGTSLPSSRRAITYVEATALTRLAAQAATRGRVRVSASLSGAAAQPPAGKAVAFEARASGGDGAWKRLGTARTGAGGEALLAGAALKPGTYELRARFKGDREYGGATSEETGFTAP